MNNCINCKHFKTPKAKVWKVGKCLKTSVHKRKDSTCEKFEAVGIFSIGDNVEYKTERYGVISGTVINVHSSIYEYPVVVQAKDSTRKYTFTGDGRNLTGSPQVLFKVEHRKTL